MEKVIEIYWRYYDIWEKGMAEIYFHDLSNGTKFWKGGSSIAPFGEIFWIDYKEDLPVIIKWVE
jgi:hypothetical protein